MLFNSVLLRLLPAGNGVWLRWLLLGASCWFYMAFVPVYILILTLTIGVDYVAGIWIEQHTGRRKKFFLVASIIVNVGVLAVFKYWDFLNHSIGDLYQALGVAYSVPDLGMLLPIGLSIPSRSIVATTAPSDASAPSRFTCCSIRSSWRDPSSGPPICWTS